MSVAPVALSEEIQERIDCGMRAQLERFRRDIANGASRIGWKLGYTTAEAQQRAGLMVPIVGTIPAGSILPNHSEIALRGADRVAAEAELVMQVSRDLDPDASEDEALKSIATIGPALELVNLSNASTDLAAILEHNVFHEAVVFGAAASFCGADHSINLLPTIMRNHTPVSKVDFLRHTHTLPRVLQLVAGILHRYGERLQAGDRIMTGSYIRPLLVRDGDVVSIEFAGMEILSVRRVESARPLAT